MNIVKGWDGTKWNTQWFLYLSYISLICLENERFGFLATAMLSWKNPKTGEVELVRFTPPIPEGYKPTSLEARHQCAVYALHRVRSSQSELN